MLNKEKEKTMFTVSDLDQFTGTMQYHSSTFGKLNLTDGVAHLCQNGAAWLVDLIESYQSGKIRQIPFQVWTLEKTGSKAVVTMKEDSDQPVLIKQEIEYTDFPVDTFTIWVQDGVCLLTSEY
jgi:hypothetical protein